MSELLHLPLEAKHVALGAKMVPFGGWLMPVQYPNGIIKEHEHTRENVSLFDISHMGELVVEGEGVDVALDGLLARPVIGQKIGVCRYNFLMNDAGGVRDDLIVYRMSEDKIMIVVNAGPRLADAEYLRSKLPEHITLTDISDNIGKIDLQGPKAFDVLSDLGFDLELMPTYFKFIETEIAGIPLILSRTGYTGERGVEFYVEQQYAGKLWDLLMEQPLVEACGLGARDTLRLEVGYALYGHELDPETTPFEVGWGGMIKLERNFVGAATLKETKQSRFLTPITLDKRRAAREGTAVFLSDETQVGVVTSGSYGPSVETAIALAYIDQELEAGTKLLLGKAPRYMTGEVTTLPFYKDGTARA